jgi:lipopolysaccharide/colanic/teichoic acid biosynthesis glycosyltransferase
MKRSADNLSLHPLPTQRYPYEIFQWLKISVSRLFVPSYDIEDFSFRYILDFYLALVLMILTFPAWILLALLIKLDSRGPVFYVQERVGRSGAVFRMYKFRTMRIDAEKTSGPVLTSKNDPRITRIGNVLRKTRIDEIPQFMNILIGDMSFIGPRPERPYFVHIYSTKIPGYRKRLRIRPGITGLAQVSNGYDKDIDDVKLKLKYDLQYIQSAKSFRMNLQILLKTLLIVIFGQGQ